MSLYRVAWAYPKLPRDIVDRPALQALWVPVVQVANGRFAAAGFGPVPPILHVLPTIAVSPPALQRAPIIFSILTAAPQRKSRSKQQFLNVMATSISLI